MKFKLTVLLATFVVTMGLLLGTSTAQAANVILDGDSVIRIENLEVLDHMENITVYDVDFVDATAIDVYGIDLDFDFPISADALAAILAVRDALNANDPIPLGAGQQSSDQFFIGSNERMGRVLAVGSEIIVGFWDDCEDECVFSVAVLDPGDSFTYADFTVAQDVAPGKATLISPSGTITENSPTYTWNAVENSTWYQLQVGEVILEWFSDDEANCGDGTGECSVTPATELADGLYNWWIRTFNQDLGGNGPWSDGMSITVDTGTDVPPGKATLISPSGTITENEPTYTWNAVENSTWYQLQVNDSTGEKIKKWYRAAEANCGDGTGECSVTPATELADGSGKWWIQTWNDFGSKWSNQMTFTVDTGTGALPGKATLISPSGTITENKPTYTWNAVENSTWYQIQVNDSTGKVILEWFSDDDTDCGDGTGECSVTPATELADGSGRWWIQTWNDLGNGPWSDALDFTVDTGTGVPPGKATLISPSGTITENEPTYTWNAVENSTWYQLQVNDSTGEVILEWFSDDEASCGDGTGECSVTPETELADGSGNWWIRTFSQDLGGNGPWSNALSFTVDTGTLPPGTNVELDGDGNVIRIENLPVTDENTQETTVYNVDFVYDTAIGVYGSTLDFDFPDDETVLVALINVVNALNSNDPVPLGAGPQGSEQFFIGNKTTDGLVVAIGGENIAGVWDECEWDTGNQDCVKGVTIMPPNEFFTWADFTVAQ